MKNRYYVTITDLKGMKCYSFDKIVKKYLLVIGILFTFSIAALITVVLILNHKVNLYSFYRIENEKLVDKIEDNKKEYLVQLEEANKKITEKEVELENITAKIDEIEKLMGEDIGIPEELTEKEKLDLAKMSVLERRFLLEVIPSGQPLDPFKGYSSLFGTRDHPVLEKKLYHYGLDFKGTKGTKIVTTADGIIEFAGYNSGGFGNLVIVAHSYGFKTYYAHMSRIDVKVGEIVKKGQKIGEVGSTGRSTGPHLHYEIHYLGKRVNPMNFTEWSIDKYNNLFEKEKGVKWQSLVEMIRQQTQIFQEKR
ncbi:MULTISPECIES: M23 family metallopeptidase [Fusobacterium]|uniref:M23 family metallopeptidase n=1 Tax=Fusobacterium TaxID=848 RepID=UPI001476EAD0|nr:MULTISPECIES: M23 family metallopeptidase [Fusobacterium]NME35886.1 M23 family metallopeptidase [Fusobacterium sp. FSA-380-WT-3A]